FNEIVHKLWEAYVPRVKTWSTETPEAAEWAKVMQFKLKKHVVVNTTLQHEKYIVIGLK
ncbi:hypothetical protein PHYSODRAFT_493241, partial [Phytophthora sojae]